MSDTNQRTPFESITTTLQGAVALVSSVPKVRFMLRGEPGVGKTAQAKAIAEKLGMDYALIDCANLSLGDLAIPVPNHDTGTINWYQNARFKLEKGEPVVILLDEFLKAGDDEMNMLHPMLEVDEPRLGDTSVPEGSVVILTGNMDTDGVGDKLYEHTRQRIVELVIKKPTAEEWLTWARASGIHPLVCAWVDRYPYAMDSYLDGNVNEFNFDPSKPQRNCVSPRVLEIASRIVYERESIGNDSAYQAALCGAGGAAFGESLMAFQRYQDSLPSTREIAENPHGAPIPTETGARAVLTYGLASRVDKATITPFLDYVSRMEEEWQCIFCINVAKDPTKQGFVFYEPRFTKWLEENEDLL
jgi:hypothetical protein